MDIDAKTREDDQDRAEKDASPDCTNKTKIQTEKSEGGTTDKETDEGSEQDSKKDQDSDVSFQEDADEEIDATEN